MTQKTLDFYFDYSSPYGYLASERIEAIAEQHNRRVRWHPILLGAVFKVTGQAPLTQAPLKGDYSVHDFHRSAREHGIEYKQPDPFPVATVAACRATLWIREHSEEEIASKLSDFVHRVFRAYYTDNSDITDANLILTLAGSLGIEIQELGQALSAQPLKDALRAEVTEAIERQVFGSPMIIIDGEPFWGHDRLEQVDRWLACGGW